MIYAIRAVGTPFIKIGKAKSVGRRLATLQTHSPFDLEILAVANWEDRRERALHRYLQDAHVRGEWFRECEAMTRVIEWMRAGEWPDGLLRPLISIERQVRQALQRVERPIGSPRIRREPDFMSSTLAKRLQALNG